MEYVLLEPLNLEDAYDLLSFEKENKDYFERFVPSRGEDFYDNYSFIHRMENLIKEQKDGIGIYFLIKNNHGNILGRINVAEFDRESGHGILGYRIGKQYIKRGIASKALQMLLDNAVTLAIHSLSAQTTTENKGSQKVLLRNGFVEDTSVAKYKVSFNDTTDYLITYRWVR